MDIQKKIAQLMEKEEFKAAFEKVVNAQDVVDLFGNNGIEVPVEVAQELFEPLVTEGEIFEADLEEVAGGAGAGKYIGSAIGNGIYYGAGYLGGRLAGWSKQKSASYAKSCGAFGSVFGGALGSFLPF